MPRLRPYYELDHDEWWLTSDDGIAKAQKKSRRTNVPDSKELIRQWVLCELIKRYQYPQAWLGEQILPVGPDNVGPHKHAMFGLCVLTSSGRPFLWISIGAAGEAEQAEAALRSVLLKDRYAGMGMSTDGSEKGTRFMRRRFDSDKCDYITDLEVYSPSETTPGLQQLYLHGFDHLDSVGEQNRTTKPLSERVENVFFEAHSHIRDIDGMHADEALDELCKILYAKLYDEEITPPEKTLCVQRWPYGSTEELAATVREIYDKANAYDTRVFSLKIPGYQRSRGVFNTAIRLSSPALAKVVETLQDYDITHSDTDIKGRAFQKVLRPSVRAGMGQYFTPEAVVKFMVKVTDPCVSDLVLDPFCGSGRFLMTCLEWVKHKAQYATDKALHEFAFGKLHGIEKSDRMVRVAMTDMRLHDDGHSNIRCTDALLAFSNYPDLQPESFDLILTNPPFGSLLGTEAIAQLGKFSLAGGRRSVPLEVLGIERCVQFLRPGGRLGIVLPDGILANRSTKYVRRWLESQVKLRAIVSLPVETFSPFGANIKTSILFVRKWRQGEPRGSDYTLFLARVDNVGYDASGRQQENSDLDATADELRTFLNNEGW